MGFFDKAKGLAQKAGAAIDKYDEKKIAREKRRYEMMKEESKTLGAQLDLEKKKLGLAKVRKERSQYGGFGGSATYASGFQLGSGDRPYNVGFGIQGGRLPQKKQKK